jgi:ubiquinone/menaquinone biosynthesis C-methylase UbiE
MNNSELIASILICPHCKGKFKQQADYLYSCKCSDHPFLDGILCLYHPELNRKRLAVQQLKLGQITQAKRTLVGNKYYYLFTLFSYLPISNNLTRIITTLLLIVLFTDARLWFKYVLFRKKNRTYYIPTRLVPRLKKSGVFVDLGIGSGEIMSEIHTKTDFSDYIGVDYSYQNLYFARKMNLKNDNILLICSDLSIYFPLKSNSIHFSLTTETINLVPSIEHFVKEVIRTTTKKGIACITSIHNEGFNNPANNITPEKFKSYIKGSLKTTLLSDTAMIEALTFDSKFKNSSGSHLKTNSSFSVVLEKK